MTLEEKTQSTVSKIIENFKSPSFLMYIAIVALFVGIGYLIYVNYIAPRISPSWIANDEFDQKFATKTIKFTNNQQPLPKGTPVPTLGSGQKVTPPSGTGEAEEQFCLPYSLATSPHARRPYDPG